MSVQRPEDNVDNDTIVLNKYSVVKKSQLADLMDGLTGLTSLKEITLVTWNQMDATAQLLDVFLLKPFPSERKALSYLRDLFYQHTLY